MVLSHSRKPSLTFCGVSNTCTSSMVCSCRTCVASSLRTRSFRSLPLGSLV